MPQLNLNFIDVPIPETCLWEQLDDKQKRLVTEILTRLLVKATRDDHQEQTNDRSLQNQTLAHAARRLRLHSPLPTRSGPT